LDSLLNDLTGLFDRNHTDDLVVIAIAVPIVGLILLATHRRRLWQIALAMQALLCGWLIWALIAALRSNSFSGDCSEAHHEGELPALIVTLGFTALMVTLILAPRILDARPWLRWVAGMGGLAPLGTGLYLFIVQPVC
jgi:hypothetical protein